MINGSQCTIIWHVDDLKISHIDPNVITDIIGKLSAVFGSESPLTICRGKVYDYLGMTIDFTQEKKVIIRMNDYVDSIISDAPDDMAGIAQTPAAGHLFEVNNKSPEYLEKQRDEMFHTMVAKLLLFLLTTFLFRIFNLFCLFLRCQYHTHIFFSVS